MVHAFTCTGLSETQYHSFSKAAGMGSVMFKTIDTSVWLSLCFFHNKLCTGEFRGVAFHISCAVEKNPFPYFLF